MQEHLGMQQNNLFKLIHITLITVLVTVIGLNIYFGSLFQVFFSNSCSVSSDLKPLSGSKDDVLYQKRQISKNAWLYITEYNGPLAISPIIFRYYLSEKIEGDTMPQLRQHCPFLEANREDVSIKNPHDLTEKYLDHLEVKTTGKIYSFQPECAKINDPVEISFSKNP